MLPPCTGNEYYVTPSGEGSKCPPSDLPCKTLDEYLTNFTETFRGDKDIRMVFLSGVHYLNQSIVDLRQPGISQVMTFQFSPLLDSKPGLVTIQMMCPVMVMLNSISRLVLTNLTVTGKFEIALNSTPTESSNQEIQLVGVSLLESSLALEISAGSITSRGVVKLNILDSTITDSSKTGLHISDVRLRGTFNLTMVNSTVSNHQRGAISIDSSTYCGILISNSTIEGNTVHVGTHDSGSNYNSNSAVGLSVYSSATRSDTVNISIQSTQFANNQDLREKPVVVYITKASVMIVTNCEFRNNHGSAIRAVGVASLTMRGDVTFRSNSAQQGGALALTSTKVSFMPGSRVTFQANSARDVGGAIFVESTLSLYDANDPNTRTDCFYQLPERDLSADYSFEFVNNSARNGGYHIYGASLKSYCVVHESDSATVRSIEQQIQCLFHFSEDKKSLASPVSSNPSRVCIIDDATIDQPPFNNACANQSLIFITRHVFPGEEFNLKAVLTGAEFGTGTGAVYAQFLQDNNNHDVKLSSSDQYSQRVDDLNAPQQLHYSIYSNSSNEILVLAATDGTILTYGDEYQISSAIERNRNTGVIPPILLTTPVFVNVTLSSCPPGFYLEPKSMGCQCNPNLCKGQVVGRLSNGRGLIYSRESIWVSAYNSGGVSGIIVHRYCPFDYCNQSSYEAGLDLTDPDAQCAMNHAGTLCGKCAAGFSLAIGSNKCLPCSNDDSVALLIYFVAAGFLLVFFIKVLNITVSQGTINGLIFYANIVWAYRGILLSRDGQEEIGIEKASFLATFIAWLNLDLGIETCFVRDLSPFTKIWIQFLFPFYIWCIAGGIILLARWSERLTKLFGNNSVQVLATLFLLSYAKLLRTVILALIPATLLVYTETGEPAESLTQVVWAFDGHLLYGRVPHVFLVVVALLVLVLLWLPYTFALLFIQPLRSNSSRWCLRWVNKLKPFFDAYTGPLNPANHFWVGLLLLARFVLLLAFISTYASSPSTSVLALNMTVIFLLSVFSFTGQLYDAPTKVNLRFFTGEVSFRSILEASYLLNVGAVGGTFLYLDSIGNDNPVTKMSVIYASILLAFLEFVTVVAYHFWCATRTCRDSVLNVLCNRHSHHSEDAVIVPTSSTVDVDVHGQIADIVTSCTENQIHYSSSSYQRLLSDLT